MKLSKKLLPYSVVAAVCLGLAWLIIFIIQQWQEPKEESLGGHLTVAKPAEGLQVRAWIATNRVFTGESITFWLAFANDSDKPIAHLRLIAFEAPEFIKQPPCWSGGIPSCQEGKLRKSTGLASGDSLTLSAQLKAPSHSGTYSPAAIFAWTSPRGTELREAITLGPIEVTTPGREKAFHVAIRIQEVLKGIAIPVALFFLGYFFQKATQRRSDQAKLSEERRTQINQVWQNLVTKTLSDAQRYYVPMLAPLAKLEIDLEKATAGDSGARQDAFYSLLLYLRRARYLAEKIGGPQFRNRRGEKVVSLAHQAFVLEVEKTQRFGRKDKDKALQIVERREDFAAFRARFSPQADPETKQFLEDLRSRFDTWLDDPDEPLELHFALLKVLMTTLDFEVNRPFELWYGRPEEFPEKELTAAKKRIEGLGSTPTIATLLAELAAYISEASKRDPDDSS